MVFELLVMVQIVFCSVDAVQTAFGRADCIGYRYQLLAELAVHLSVYKNKFQKIT